MKRAKQDSKLEFGLQAYADSAAAGGTLTGLRQRLGSWPVYAAAAGSALALSTSAMANTIVYNGSPNSQNTNIDGDEFSVFHVSTQPGVNAVAGLKGSGIAVQIGSTFAQAFQKSQSVTSARKFRAGHATLALRTVSLFAAAVGSWPSNGTRYAAFKLPNGDLGWIKIAVGTPIPYAYPDSVDILAWAYNDVAGQPILAGETATPTHGSTVPEPNSLALALLATGSMGVLAFRRRRKAAASKTADSVQ